MRSAPQFHANVTEVDGAFISRSGRKFSHNGNAAQQLGALCQADADKGLPPGIKFRLFNGTLHIISGERRARLRRYTGKHLRAALRRLNNTKDNTNDNPTNQARC